MARLINVVHEYTAKDGAQTRDTVSAFVEEAVDYDWKYPDDEKWESEKGGEFGYVQYRLTENARSINNQSDIDGLRKLLDAIEVDLKKTP